MRALGTYRQLVPGHIDAILRIESPEIEVLPLGRHLHRLHVVVDGRAVQVLLLLHLHGWGNHHLKKRLQGRVSRRGLLLLDWRRQQGGGTWRCDGAGWAQRVSLGGALLEVFVVEDIVVAAVGDEGAPLAPAPTPS